MQPRVASRRSLWCALAVAVLCAACKTPEGPRLPLPPQDLATPVPAGYVRVVLFNDSDETRSFVSGTIRIQIDGRTAPSLYLNHYAQLFLKPGRHELVLQHWDFHTHTNRYEVEITPAETHLRVWKFEGENEYEIVKALPPDFPSRFTGGRDLSQWPVFQP